MKNSEIISPAVDHLIDMLEVHEISAKSAAQAMGISPQYFNNILKGHKKLSLSVCFKLEAWTGLRSSFWWDLESSFRIAEYRFENASEFEHIEKSELITS